MSEADDTASLGARIAALEASTRALEAATRLGHRSQVSTGRAVTEMHRQMVVDAAVAETRHQEAVRLQGEVRDALRAARAPACDIDDGPVHEEKERLQLNALQKAGKLLDAVFSFPSTAVRWAWNNKLTTTSTTIAIGGFLISMADGAPWMDALGRMLIAIGSGITPIATGSAP